MEEKSLIQEEEYIFPYHHIPDFKNFSQAKCWPWGYRYVGGVNLILKELKKVQFNSLIDVGCGDGRLTKELSKEFFQKRIMGVDYSKKAIAFAKAFSPETDYRVINILDQKIEEKFDVAVLTEVLEHISKDKIKDFLQEISETLNPAGYLILTVPHKNKKLQKKHYQHFTSNQLRELLSPFFNVQKVIFFDKKSKIFILLDWVLQNKFFIINNKHLLNFFYNFYQKRFFYTKEERCGRVFILARKL